MRLKSIVPATRKKLENVLESRQFGDIPFEFIFRERPVSGRQLKFRGKSLLAVEKGVIDKGWSVLVLVPMGGVVVSGVIGIVSTLFLLLGIWGYLFYLRLSERAFSAIKEREDKFRLLSEAANEGVVVHEEGRIIEANERFAEMLGYDLRDIIGADMFDYIDPEDRAAVKSRVKAGYDKPYEMSIRRKDASTLLVEASGRSMDYRGGTVRVVAMRDISTHKEMQGVLERVAQEWVTTFNAIPDLLSIHDKNFRIVRANRAFADFFGMTMAEVIGKTCHEVIHKTKEPIKACPFELSLKTRSKQTAEFL